MSLVLDASVAVAGARPGEPAHAVSRRLLERVLAGRESIVVPSLFPVEVASALARAGEDAGAVRALLRPLARPPHRIVALGAARARRVAEVAMACRLRAADALYVWVAEEHGVPLVTLDEELIERAAERIEVRRP